MISSLFNSHFFLNLILDLQHFIFFNNIRFHLNVDIQISVINIPHSILSLSLRYFRERNIAKTHAEHSSQRTHKPKI